MRKGGLCAAAVLLLLTTAPALAAELGALKLWSGLGQPLNAEIDLRNVRPGERIAARVAPATTYRRYDLAYTDTAGATRVAIRRRPNGDPYLAISTPARTNEPVVELLVELTSAGRSAIANYTLFLDPPKYHVPTTAAVVAPPAPVAEVTPPPPPPPIVDVTPPPPAAPPPAAIASEPKPDTLALVKPPQPPKPQPPPAAALESPRFSISRYELEGASRVPRDRLENVLASYTGPDKDFDTIQSAVAAVEKTYADAGYGAVRVIIPEQDIEDGVVRLRIAEATVGKVEVVGNKHYSEANIRRSVPQLKEGEAPNVNAIAGSLRLANESTTKNTQLTFSPSPDPQLVNATLRVVDTNTRRWALSVDNTGSESTGHWRTGVAYQDSNVFDRDHALALQFVTAPSNPGNVLIFGASYRVPLYGWGGAVEVVGGHSNVNAGSVNTTAGSYGIKGAGGFAGIHYVHLLPRYAEWDQRVTAALDYRYYKNDVQLVGGPGGSLIPDFDTLPLSLTYAGHMRGATTELQASVSAIQNIPRGSRGTAAAYQQPGGRQDAAGAYRLLRYSLDMQHTLPRDWRVRAGLYGQHTSDALISGEQFGLGGIDAVRGLGERAITNDKGNRATVEVYTPQMSPAEWVSGRVLLFLDGGEVRRNHALPGEITKSQIGTAGLGLRATLMGSAHLRIDSAYVFEGDPQFPRGSTKTHARLIYLF